MSERSFVRSREMRWRSCAAWSARFGFSTRRPSIPRASLPSERSVKENLVTAWFGATGDGEASNRAAARARAQSLRCERFLLWPVWGESILSVHKAAGRFNTRCNSEYNVAAAFHICLPTVVGSKENQPRRRQVASIAMSAHHLAVLTHTATARQRRSHGNDERRELMLRSGGRIRSIQ